MFQFRSHVGLLLLPHSLTTRPDSLFASYARAVEVYTLGGSYCTGKYKTINLLSLCAVVPFIVLREDMGFVQLSVVPIGFGHAVVFQTVSSTSPAHACNGSLIVFGMVALQVHLSDTCRGVEKWNGGLRCGLTVSVGVWNSVWIAL